MTQDARNDAAAKLLAEKFAADYTAFIEQTQWSDQDAYLVWSLTVGRILFHGLSIMEPSQQEEWLTYITAQVRRSLEWNRQQQEASVTDRIKSIMGWRDKR